MAQGGEAAEVIDDRPYQAAALREARRRAQKQLLHWLASRHPAEIARTVLLWDLALHGGCISEAARRLKIDRRKVRIAVQEIRLNAEQNGHEVSSFLQNETESV